jgi:hypothetical protein
VHEAEAVESRGLIVLAQFDGRTAIFAENRRVLRETPVDIQGVWGDGEAGAEAGAESVGRLDQRADAENAEPLVGRDPRPWAGAWAEAWAEWSHAPEPFA